MNPTSPPRQSDGAGVACGCCDRCDGWAVRAAHRALTAGLHRAVIDMHNALFRTERADHDTSWDLAGTVNNALNLLDCHSAVHDTDVYSAPHRLIVQLLRDARRQSWDTVTEEARIRARELLDDLGHEGARLEAATRFASIEALNTDEAVAVAVLLELADGLSE